MAEFKLKAFDEWTAQDPFGKVKAADGQARVIGEPVVLRAARGAYASFRLVVTGKGDYALSASVGGGLNVELYKSWYHRMTSRGAKPFYTPDALVPLKKAQKLRLPDPENRIPRQKQQEFWVDVFVPRGSKAGVHSGRIVLRAGGANIGLDLEVEVVRATLPDEPVVVMDNNSYGCRWLAEMYPEVYGRSKGAKYWSKTIELLHHYYRISREHRTVLHNLGYGHSGLGDPIYAPKIAGRGRSKRLTDWKLYDAHYGPLLSGETFKTAAPGLPPARMKASPIWGVYTPINPDWPADYLWWGEPGYEVEFVNCVKQLDAHLRKKGWTRSRIEFFLNHKKRYRWYEWDGDEQKYAKDNARHQDMVDLWEKATKPSRVNWVYRADASWQMKRQFEELGGHRNFWVCGGFINWYPREVKRVLDRGEHVWWYGGYPAINAASSAPLQNLWRTWARGLHGFCHWLAVSPGKDPWFNCTGAATGPIYPGERFGIPGPIPSARLKILRNGIQDIDLLESRARKAGKLERVRKAIARKVPIVLWQEPPPAARRLPPEDWDSENLATEHEPIMEAIRSLEPDWWKVVRDRAFQEVK